MVEKRILFWWCHLDFSFLSLEVIHEHLGFAKPLPSCITSSDLIGGALLVLLQLMVKGPSRLSLTL